MCDFFVVASTFDELNIGKVLCNISHPLLKVGYNKKKHIQPIYRSEPKFPRIYRMHDRCNSFFEICVELDS